VPNYDGTTTEPTLLPVTFPTILANNTLGIAVGMACNICSFNLAELCRTTVALMKDPDHDIASTLPAPDFVGGGQILYDAAEMQSVIDTGRGSVRVRARYRYAADSNMIEITEIPPTTTVEAIMDKITELAKAGRIREISDMRDETDLNGLKLTLDLKRGQDPDKLMARLFKMTPLEDAFSCNFNILIAGQPRVMGVREILNEWTAFRMECVRRRTFYDLEGKKKRLHLLQALDAILLDIDKAVRIVRETEEEAEVVPNLMIGFGIDEVQAEYVAEIKLRHLNREYILKRTAETDDLEKAIADLEDILKKPARIRKIIMAELEDVAARYGRPRRSEILYELPDAPEEEQEPAVADYPVTLFFTREGYFKKITPQSLRMSGEQKLKEGDEITWQAESRNNVELLFFTDRCQVYKCRAADFEDGKASAMGAFVASTLGMDEGESPVFLVPTLDYRGWMLFLFQNGKCAKVPLAAYETKQNRRKLLKAYSDKAPLARMLYLPEETEIAIRTSAGRLLLVGTAQISEKTTRDSIGVAVITLKKNQTVESVKPAAELELANPHRYRVRTLPAAGALLREEDTAEQMTLL
jgi:DNA gyrase subunit A